MVSPSSLTTPVIETFQANQDALRRWIWSLTRPLDETEDILQEVLLRALCAERKRPIALPRPFLFQIAKNCALSARKRAVRIAHVDPLGEEFSEHFGAQHALSCEPSPLDSLIAIESLETFLSSLTPARLRVCELHKVEKMTMSEVAYALRIAPSTVEKHLARVNRSIKDAFV